MVQLRPRAMDQPLQEICLHLRTMVSVAKVRAAPAVGALAAAAPAAGAAAAEQHRAELLVREKKHESARPACSAMDTLTETYYIILLFLSLYVFISVFGVGFRCGVLWVGRGGSCTKHFACQAFEAMLYVNLKIESVSVCTHSNLETQWGAVSTEQASSSHVEVDPKNPNTPSLKTLNSLTN